MSARRFVDPDILMYAHDASTGAKHERALPLVEELSAEQIRRRQHPNVAGSAVNVPKKAKKPLEATRTRDLVSDYLTGHVVVNNGESILEALDLESRYRVLPERAGAAGRSGFRRGDSVL